MPATCPLGGHACSSRDAADRARASGIWRVWAGLTVPWSTSCRCAGDHPSVVNAARPSARTESRLGLRWCCVAARSRPAVWSAACRRCGADCAWRGHPPCRSSGSCYPVVDHGWRRVRGPGRNGGRPGARLRPELSPLAPTRGRRAGGRLSRDAPPNQAKMTLPSTGTCLQPTSTARASTMSNPRLDSARAPAAGRCARAALLAHRRGLRRVSRTGCGAVPVPPASAPVARLTSARRCCRKVRSAAFAVSSIARRYD